MRPPAMTALLVGSGDFVKIGSDIRDDLISKCRLSPTAAVLEIGCGYGRVAVALTSYLDQTGKYDGIDVVKDATDWCEKEISSRYPNFRFLYADVSNPYARNTDGMAAIDYKLPFNDGTYDVVFLTSVFSHMRPDEILAYLNEISRVLKKGGRCLATYYLLNPFSIQQIEKKKSSQNFKYSFDGFLSTHRVNPEQTIAVPEETIRAFYATTDLQIEYPISYGSWPGRESQSYQDVIASIKS